MKSLLKYLAIAGATMFATVAFAASTNDSPTYNTLYVSDAQLSNNKWSNSVTISSGELLSFELHYYLDEGISANDMRFSLENLNGRTFSAGSNETVTGSVKANNLSTANGSVNVYFSDNVKLELYNVSWQKYPCQSVGCESSLVDSFNKVLTSQGMSIGNVSGDNSHYTGNVIVSFKVVSQSNPVYENCVLDGVTVNHGTSKTFFSTRTTTGTCSAYDQVRTCNDGVLSGSSIYRYNTCDDDQSNGDDPRVVTENYDNVDEDSATVYGFVDMNDSDDVEFWIEYGTDSDLDSYSKSNVEDVDSNDTVDVRLTGLDDYTRYYYRAVIKDIDHSGKIIRGSIKNFRTDKGDSDNTVSAETKSATSISERDATLRGYADINDADSARVWFEYGTSISSLSSDTSKKYVRNSGSYDDDIDGLKKCTTYYYRFVVKDEDSNDTDYGTIKNFTTDGNNCTTPTTIDALAVTNVASAVSTNAAQLNSWVFGEGTGTCYFQYGRTSALGSVTPRVSVNMDSYSTCSSYRTGLASGTNYYYRAVLEQNGKTYYGSTMSLRTNSVYVTPVTPVNPTTPTVVTIVQPAEELSAMKWVSAENDVRFDTETNAMPGETVYYKVRVTNNTNKDLTNVVVIDRIPYYLELDDLQSLDDDDAKQLRWVINLDRGESRTFVTQLRVREDAHDGDVIESYASAEHDTFSINSNDVLISVYDRAFQGNGDGNQQASIFGAGFLPSTLNGWGLLFLILLAIAYFVSRILVSRNENAKVLAELHAAKSNSNHT